MCVCVCVCVWGDFVWTSHMLTTQGPSNLNYSPHVVALLDVCLISIMQQRPGDKHVSYYRVENVRSKLRKFKSRNDEFFSCRKNGCRLLQATLSQYFVWVSICLVLLVGIHSGVWCSGVF